jgi:hypothetical protein
MGHRLCHEQSLERKKLRFLAGPAEGAAEILSVCCLQRIPVFIFNNAAARLRRQLFVLSACANAGFPLDDSPDSDR